MVEVSANHSILCNEKLFVPHIDKNKTVVWTFTVKSSVRFLLLLNSVHNTKKVVQHSAGIPLIICQQVQNTCHRSLGHRPLDYQYRKYHKHL